MNFDEYAHRWKELEKLQEHYSDFRDFYGDVSENLLGFEPTWLQYDIADYVANGPLWAMVQAQRGQAKTTIAGCYAVWCLIHDPSMRVLILSAGSKMAKQISIWCIQIIMNMPELEILRGDKSNPGTRSSVEEFDIHHMLKGAEKSPSIACLGITSNMQGYRADLLIPDDVESSKNALTQLMREQLRHLTRDFSSINSKGKILYLGTPQSVDSIYNDLPSRDFAVRIWPGRYPSVKEQQEVYGNALAPSLQERLKADPTLRTGGGIDGDLGQPTDPGMLDEFVLNKKVLDQGMAYFNLQFMLNTSLMDQDRYPLKLKDLMFWNYQLDESQGSFKWTNDPANKIPHPAGSPLHNEHIYLASNPNEEYFHYTSRLMSIDPAGGGQNGDETGVSVIFECNGFLSVQWVTGLPGGTSPDKFDKIISIIKRFSINEILVEKNFGAGAYAEALRGALKAADVRCGIEEVWATGQKELRIIDSLDPVIGSHRLIFDRRVLEHDIQSTQKYPAQLRSSYQVLFQICKITRIRNALIHDDRLDSLAQGVRHLITRISINAADEIAKKKAQKLKEYQSDPKGMWRNSHTQMKARNRVGGGNAMGRFGGSPGKIAR
jgi:hypothetical protein